MAGKVVYRVRFINEGKVYELYAREVTSGSLFGFVEVAKLVWGGKSSVIVDPNEQSLRNEFEGVKRIYVPMQAIVRIDEVDKTGAAKVVPLPGGAKGEGATVVPIYSTGAPKPTSND